MSTLNTRIRTHLILYHFIESCQKLLNSVLNGLPFFFIGKTLTVSICPLHLQHSSYLFFFLHLKFPSGRFQRIWWECPVVAARFGVMIMHSLSSFTLDPVKFFGLMFLITSHVAIDYSYLLQLFSVFFPCDFEKVT